MQDHTTRHTSHAGICSLEKKGARGGQGARTRCEARVATLPSVRASSSELHIATLVTRIGTCSSTSGHNNVTAVATIVSVCAGPFAAINRDAASLMSAGCGHAGRHHDVPTSLPVTSVHEQVNASASTVLRVSGRHGDVTSGSSDCLPGHNIDIAAHTRPPSSPSGELHTAAVTIASRARLETQCPTSGDSGVTGAH